MSFDTNLLSFTEKLLAPRRNEATPWLVWHSAQGERIELSGRVFDNWVSKSTHLLSDLFDVEDGSQIVMDLPTHWKSLVISLAAFHLGATVLTPDHPEATSADLWVSDNPSGAHIPGRAHILAVDLAALALQFSGDLGAAEDYNATVRTFADQYFPTPVDGSLPALTTADGSLSYDRLFTPAASSQGTILVSATLPLDHVLGFAIAQWFVGDALVLIGPGVEPSERLLTGERVTASYPAK